MSVNTSSVNIPITGDAVPLVSTNATSSGEIGMHMAHHCKSWFSQHGTNILFGIFLLITLWVAVACLASIAESESIEADASILGAAALYANSIRHAGCKGNGGCSTRCPYVSQDDPRVVMKKQTMAIENLYNTLKQGLEEDQESNQIEVAKIETEKKRKETTDTLKVYSVMKQRCIDNIAKILSKAKDITTMNEQSKEVTAGIINAKNRVGALYTAASFNKHAFASVLTAGNSLILLNRLVAIPKAQYKQIGEYDKIVAECNSRNKAILDLSSKLISAGDQKYDKLLLAVMDNAITSENIITALASFMTLDGQSHDQVHQMMLEYDTMASRSSKALNQRMKDSFGNALPGKLNVDQYSNLIANNDYTTALIKTALEADVVKNHRKFAKERSSFDSGGGVPSQPDHRNDLVPWVGPFGAPTYRRSDGSSAEKPNAAEPLRSIPSDKPEDLMNTSSFKLSYK